MPSRCVDETRPFKSFTNYEEMKAHFDNVLDRNEQMAKIISETILTKRDNRNSLFIVGTGPVYKSPVPGFGVGKPKSKSKQTAAA